MAEARPSLPLPSRSRQALSTNQRSIEQRPTCSGRSSPRVSYEYVLLGLPVSACVEYCPLTIAGLFDYPLANTSAASLARIDSPTARALARRAAAEVSEWKVHGCMRVVCGVRCFRAHGGVTGGGHAS